MAGTPMVDARWAHLVSETLLEKGFDLGPLLDRAGLTQSQISDPERRIAFYKHGALLDLAAKATEDSLFGLRLGLSVRPKQAGALGFLALSSDTLGDALRNLERYNRVLSEGGRAQLHSRRGNTELTLEVIDPQIEKPNQVVEFGLGATLSVCRALVGQDVPLQGIFVAHAPNASLRSYRQATGVAIEFQARRNALSLGEGALDLPIRTADSSLHRVLVRCCTEILGQGQQDSDLIKELRAVLTGKLTAGEPSMDLVARDLGMSQRTLARRLADRGTSFRLELDALRHSLALRYLQQKDLRPSQVAYLLGYAEPSAFNHAFDRWTGTTPSAYRSA